MIVVPLVTYVDGEVKNLGELDVEEIQITSVGTMFVRGSARLNGSTTSLDIQELRRLFAASTIASIANSED
jgi:hypothetical protein